jgi:C1A family cysteine protease
MATRLYLARRDQYDTRDKYYVPDGLARLARAGAGGIDLGKWLPEPRDQGNEGACTMFAASGMLAWHFNRFKGKSLVFSPQFGYRAERIIEGTTDLDAGAQSRTMMKVLVTYGLPLEESFPYNDSEWTRETPFALLAEARQHRMGAYHRVASLFNLKTVLDSGYIASLGIEVYESFESDRVAETGEVPMPSAGEKLLGGHEVYTYGYDEQRQVLLCRNSWGKDWGRQGNFTLPFDFFNKHAMDCWTCHFGKPW